MQRRLAVQSPSPQEDNTLMKTCTALVGVRFRTLHRLPSTPGDVRVGVPRLSVPTNLASSILAPCATRPPHPARAQVRFPTTVDCGAVRPGPRYRVSDETMSGGSVSAIVSIRCLDCGVPDWLNPIDGHLEWLGHEWNPSLFPMTADDIEAWWDAGRAHRSDTAQ